MSMPERPACTALDEYMREDDELFDKIRMSYEWDEGAFQRLVQVSTRCLEEIQHDEMIPRYVASFFGYWLHLMMGMMQHPNFLALNRQGRTQEDTEAYFRECIAIMQRLVRWMSNGTRPYPSAQLTLPGWKSLATEEDTDASTTLLPLARESTPTLASARGPCTALRDQVREDSPLFEKLRANLDWDDEAFRTLVGLGKSCLEGIEHDDMIPRYVASCFGDRLQDLKQTMLDQQFQAHNREARTNQENKTYFARRIEIIQKFVSWMSSGKCPYPQEHFVLAEWHIDL